MITPTFGLDAHASSHPDRSAVEFVPLRDRSLEPARLSFAELDGRSRLLAGAFRAQGLRRGDSIAMLCSNRPEFFVVAWAAQRSGLRYTPVPTGSMVDEARHIVLDSGARLLVADPELGRLAAEIAPGGPAAHNLLIGADSGSGLAPGFDHLDHVLAAASPIGEHEQSEGAPLLYSSGSSGRPKGVEVPLPTGGWGSDHGLAARFSSLYGMQAGDVFYCPAPLYHAAPLLYTMAAHRVGATVIVNDGFDAAGALATIEQFGVTHSLWVPTMFVRMLALSAADRGRHDLSTHRVALHGAAPCPADVKERMLDWWGPIIWEYYSSTERVGVTTISPAEWRERPTSVGRPLNGEPHICDDEGRELPRGEIGTIWFAGAVDFVYRNRDEDTMSSTDHRGWRTVHDLGWLDHDGYLHLADRRSDLIVTGGVNVSPREVELVLIDHPDVVDAAVIGVPDHEYGRTVTALVELSPGRHLAVQDLKDWCAQRLGVAKRPRRIELLDHLPRTDTGKLRRHDLQNALLDLEPGTTPTTPPNRGIPA